MLRQQATKDSYVQGYLAYMTLCQWAANTLGNLYYVQGYLYPKVSSCCKGTLETIAARGCSLQSRLNVVSTCLKGAEQPKGELNITFKRLISAS